MYVKLSTTFEAVIDHGTDGLAGTIRVRIDDNEGNNVVAPSAADISEIAFGVYAATRTSPSSEGQYTIIWDEGTDDSVVGVEDLVVTLTGDPATPTTPGDSAFGPCQPWITGDDVADCGESLGIGTDTSELDGVAADASGILYELSGRVFPGLCRRTVRPCSERTTCWIDNPGIAYSWSSVDSLWIGTEGPRNCGCNRESRVKLAGTVRAIVSVKIDGVELPQFDDDGNRNWRVDRGRYLTRMDSPGPPAASRYWPGCQNMSLDDTERGTFSIDYLWGEDPPEIAKTAAAQLARELWKVCTPGSGECKLPSKVTRVVRQGVTVERVMSIASMLRSGSTGLQALDAFLASVNSTGARRRPAVWSPDVQPYAREVGQ